MRLLIATGGAKHSEKALLLGGQMARNVRTATVLTVMKRPEDKAKAEAVLAHARQLLQPTVPEVNTLLRQGNPAEQIVAVAREGQYDLVVVGERPKHRFATRFLGSTATHVVERAPCPVAIAKGEIQPLHHILLCDSGAASQTLLRRLADQLPALAGGEVEITILHVMSQISAGPAVNGQQLQATAEQLINDKSPEGAILQRDVMLLARPTVRARPKIRHGLVVEEIRAEAQSGNYDLIVIGAHQREGWQWLLLDDIAHQIVLEADRPVLVLR
jgi:nucleotide-binding universal stress UspA family protein